MTLPAESHSVRLARHAAHVVLAAWQLAYVEETAVLIVSELVTNAVRHAGAPADVKIRLTVSIADDIVRAEVRDGGRGFQPSPRDAPQLEAGGWGLHLVDRLASRWGVERGQPARVWFEVEPAV